VVRGRGDAQGEEAELEPPLTPFLQWRQLKIRVSEFTSVLEVVCEPLHIPVINDAVNLKDWIFLHIILVTSYYI